MEVATPAGVARLHPSLVADAAGLLVLGHGAGGGIAAPDLRAAVTAANGAGWDAVLVEQPWRVAGRKIAGPPASLDTGWRAAVPAAAALSGAPRHLVTGGRSAGARVACRTAAELGAAGVLCLAFPLHPPGRPERSRAPELALPDVPVLVVQGSRDTFGRPEELDALALPGVTTVPVEGDHALRASASVVGPAVAGFLRGVAAPGGTASGR